MGRILVYRLLLLLAVAGLAGSATLGPGSWCEWRDAQATDDSTSEEEQRVEFQSDASEDSSGDEEEGLAAPADAAEPPVAGAETAGPNLTGVVAVLVMVVFTLGLLGSLSTGLLIHEGVRTGVLIAGLGPLLAMVIKGERATLSRGRILGYVEAHPGIHFSALRDALGLANGVTSHHLHALEREGRVLSWADGSRRRFAASGIDPATVKTLEHPVTGMQKAILQTLADSGALGLSASDLRTHLEATRQLMSYHLQRLDERALVAREGKGRKATWRLTETGMSLLAAQVESAI